MADTFYSLATSATRRDATAVVISSSTTAGSDIELRVEDGAKWNDTKVLEAIEAIKERILTGGVQKDRVVSAVPVSSAGD